LGEVRSDDKYLTPTRSRRERGQWVKLRTKYVVKEKSRRLRFNNYQKSIVKNSIFADRLIRIS